MNIVLPVYKADKPIGILMIERNKSQLRLLSREKKLIDQLLSNSSKPILKNILRDEYTGKVSYSIKKYENLERDLLDTTTELIKGSNFNKVKLFLSKDEKKMFTQIFPQKKLKRQLNIKNLNINKSIILNFSEINLLNNSCIKEVLTKEWMTYTDYVFLNIVKVGAIKLFVITKNISKEFNESLIRTYEKVVFFNFANNQKSDLKKKLCSLKSETSFLFENLPDGIILINRENKVVYFNK